VKWVRKDLEFADLLRLRSIVNFLGREFFERRKLTLCTVLLPSGMGREGPVGHIWKGLPWLQGCLR